MLKVNVVIFSRFGRGSYHAAIYTFSTKGMEQILIMVANYQRHILRIRTPLVCLRIDEFKP